MSKLRCKRDQNDSVRTFKIVVVGDFGVGKTSTVARFVNNVFSDKYLTTVGVKIDTKELQLPDHDEVVKLVIWDVAGTDRFAHLELAYLRGAAGYLLVADGTRSASLESAISLKNEITENRGDLPFVLLANKCDLDELWEIPESRLDDLRCQGASVYVTSAKIGENVETALQELTTMMVEAAGA